ncbi:protein IRON-RELATED TRANSCRIPTION FACTOR 3 isoform X1 [Elaeis guineensis]|uniref:Transcription factor BHLH062 isoform X1 n=1 Tax=Elaeis guineensis var. tenera TaxID=51953 RepID=A0A6I9R310_ELAGV|nr:transcription factor BHLH062 isoform X1 [Elaeis guineensis]
MRQPGSHYSKGVLETGVHCFERSIILISPRRARIAISTEEKGNAGVCFNRNSDLFSSDTAERSPNSSRESNSSMISDHPSSMAKETNVAADKPVDGSLLNKKSQGRVPKKIHKAEREKLKREQLNELFLELGRVVEPARQNNGKATILVDASRILRDLLAQVESLRKENAALLTESSYVTAEKNELRDENAALQADIAELQSELQVRMMSDSVWTNSTAMSPPTLPQPASTVLPLQQQPPDIRPVHGAPIRELQLFPESTATQTEPTPSSNVTRPHARYPTPSSFWPGQLLSSLPRTAQEEQYLSGTSSISTISSREEGSDKA